MTRRALAQALGPPLRRCAARRSTDTDKRADNRGAVAARAHGRGARSLTIVAVLLGLLAITASGASASIHHGPPPPYVCQQISGTWCPVSDMAVMRWRHTATLLPNGMVLITGGDEVSCYEGCPAADWSQLYNPTTQQFQFTTGPMTQDRTGHTATLLLDGTVLVVGGYALANPALCSAELYDPNSGLWTSTGSMHACRSDHTATLLPNGEVLVAGGTDSKDNSVSSAELYNPFTHGWTVTGAMSSARSIHSAALLPDGTVLVAGGEQSPQWSNLSSAETYNSFTGAWTITQRMPVPRSAFPLVTLPFGVLLAVGGGNGAVALTGMQMYYGGQWTPTSPMAPPRGGETATLLQNNMVLVAGGCNNVGSSLSSAALYNPFANSWSTTAAMTASRCAQAATLLPNGQVLVTGGVNQPSSGLGQDLASAEVYTP